MIIYLETVPNHNSRIFNVFPLPFVCGNQPEITDYVAGKPAVNGRRYVHDAALNARLFRRLDHLI